MAVNDWLNRLSNFVGFGNNNDANSNSNSVISELPSGVTIKPVTDTYVPSPLMPQAQDNPQESLADFAVKSDKSGGVIDDIAKGVSFVASPVKSIFDGVKSLFAKDNEQAATTSTPAIEEYNKYQDPKNNLIENIFGNGKWMEGNLQLFSRVNPDKEKQFREQAKSDLIFKVENEVGNLQEPSFLTSGFTDPLQEGTGNLIPAGNTGQQMGMGNILSSPTPQYSKDNIIALVASNPKAFDIMSKLKNSGEYGKIKEIFGTTLDNSIIDKIVDTIPKKQVEVETALQTKIEDLNKRKTLTRNINPVAFDAYEAQVTDLRSSLDSMYKESESTALQAGLAKGLTIKLPDGKIVPKGKGIKYMAEYLDDQKKFLETVQGIATQSASIQQVGIAQGSDIGTNYTIDTAKTIMANKVELDKIKQSIGDSVVGTADVNRNLNDKLNEMGYRSIQHFMVRNTKYANGGDASETMLSPEDLLKWNVRQQDMGVRLGLKATPTNVRGSVNNVGAFIEKPIEAITEEGLQNLGVIGGYARADIGYDATTNPSGGEAGLRYGMRAQYSDALPETLVAITSIIAGDKGLSKLANTAGFVEGAVQGGRSANFFNAIGRLSVKTIPNEILQNVTFNAMDSGINTDDQKVFDAIGGLLGMGMDAYGSAKGLYRYAKNQDIIERKLAQSAKSDAVASEAVKIMTGSPVISRDDALEQARIIVNTPGYDLPKVSMTPDEVKQTINAAKQLEDIEIAFRANATPEQIKQIDELKKLGFTKEKIVSDILDKGKLTDEDVWNYTRLINAAKNPGILISDLIKAADNMDLASRFKVYGMLANPETAASKVPFRIENPEEISYITNMIGKFSPTEQYSLSEMGDIAKKIASETDNPMKLHVDILDKNTDGGYKYFKQEASGKFSLNTEGYKKFGIVDQRGMQSVVEKSADGVDFYKAAEEDASKSIPQEEIDTMRKNSTRERVNKAVHNIVPCI